MGKKLQFRVSAALKSVIGRDLITNDFVAIFELVKNSIDAGASKIVVDFDLEKGPNSCIRVIDNGKGMSFEDIEDKWLFLAYSAKKEGTEDRQTKVYAGNKGVGRFSGLFEGSSLSFCQRKCRSQHRSGLHELSKRK